MIRQFSPVMITGLNYVMTSEIYTKTFDNIKAATGKNIVTVGDCIATMIAAPSNSNERTEAGLTAIAFLRTLPCDDLLTPELKSKMEQKIANTIAN